MPHSTVYQNSVPEVDPDMLRLADDAFERWLPEVIEKVVPSAELMAMYSDGAGTPPRSPSMLLAMLLLQFLYGVPDRELVARCRCDLRWRYAISLGSDGRREPPGTATVTRFRRRLRDAKGDDFLLRKVLELATAEGMLPVSELQGVDSTNTNARGATLDTFNLIAAAIGKLVRLVAPVLSQPTAKLAAELKLERYLERSMKGTATIDWSDEAARNTFLTEEIRDAQRLVQHVRAFSASLPETVKEALALLEKVTLQDVEQLADGSYRIARGTTPDRTISVTDPEGRHGRKSSSKVINGYKTHVIGTLESQFVTGIVVTPASTHDATPTLELIDQADRNGVKPVEAVGDAAYGTGANVRRCADAGVALFTKLPASSTPNVFSKRDFTVDLDTMTVTCPSGTTISWTSMVKDPAGSDTKVAKFQFDKATCAACPLRTACSAQTKRGEGRAIVLSVYEAELQRLKSFNQSERAPAVLKARSAIERLISHLVRLGMRNSRFFGRLRTQAQAYLIAAAYNLQRYITLRAASA